MAHSIPTLRLSSETGRVPVSLMARIALFILPLFVHISCFPRQGLVHMIIPVNRPDTEISGTASALIRSIYCDIRVDPVDGDLWRRILGSDAYTAGRQTTMRRRIPPVTAFLVTVKNTVNAPVRMDYASVRHGTTEAGAMSAEEMKTRFASATYSNYRFGSMLAFRRILNESDPPGMLDFDRDTITLMLDFIPPGDSVLKIITFERIPPDVREFTLSFIVSAMGSKKNIDFQYLQLDYRTTDREYIRLKEKADEKNAYYGE